MRPQLLEWMSRDCERLLELVSQRSKKIYACPAQALPALLKVLKYKMVLSAQVPEDVYAFTHFDRCEVVVAKDLPRRLAYPNALRGVVHSCLAHELGHIRMHAQAARRGKRGVSWESEAHAYSCAFLVPYRDLMRQPETCVLRGGLLQDQESCWKQVLALAERYEVSGAFMAIALQRYGIIKFDGKRRTIRPCTVLVRRATKVA